ncbi:hypothetical protein HO173_012604 [Letharia columbiana]|uniref:Uncharacterized protein n=1 Tax=Letharia columbiana TaxID=112416 RepID=A0A8H6CML4_9LECA|nr:uncharacterized protein HO173_012604 [Letharia columbiana]KAF6226014.1 hypothetical protein HO173_012604 [Letharia columbiana]
MRAYCARMSHQAIACEYARRSSVNDTFHIRHGSSMRLLPKCVNSDQVAEDLLEMFQSEALAAIYAKDFALASVGRGDEIECLAFTIASNHIIRSPNLS